MTKETLDAAAVTAGLGDNELPDDHGCPTCTHLLRLTIYITSDAQPGEPIGKLNYHIEGFDAVDRDEATLGVDTVGEDVDAYIQEFLSAAKPVGTPLTGAASTPFEDATLVASPLDFKVLGQTRVIIRLFGDGWIFESMKDSLRTVDKQDLYCNPVGYKLGAAGTWVEAGKDERCQAICFSAKGAEKKKTTKANLRVVFLDGVKELPVTIDPGIENQGGRH